MPSTPLLPCPSSPSITSQPSPPPSHPLQSPTYNIPSTLLPHIHTASDHLHAGRTVAVPTETVYGLAANSLNPQATSLIYKIKNRPSDNPLIIHVSSLDMLSTLLPPDYRISRLYMALITAFWPGPLTLLFPSPSPPPLPAPQTNAIRMPNHPLTLALISHSNLPLSAPSANSSGRPSPTRARDVVNDLDGAEGLGCILDGGDCGVGVESTVVDGSGWREGGNGFVDVLRPGGLGVEEVKRVVDTVDGTEGMTEIRLHGKTWSRNAEASGSKLPDWAVTAVTIGEKAEAMDTEGSSKAYPSTPGMKYRHYSPRIPVYLLLPSTSFPRSKSHHPPSGSSHSLPTDPRAILEDLTRRLATSKPRLGFLHYESSPLFSAIRSLAPDQAYSMAFRSLGPDSTSAAQRLFSGLLDLERGQDGVDAILVEGCTDEGLGLAVMERVGKAVGGGGKVGELGNGELKQGVDKGRYWVQL